MKMNRAKILKTNAYCNVVEGKVMKKSFQVKDDHVEENENDFEYEKDFENGQRRHEREIYRKISRRI